MTSGDRAPSPPSPTHAGESGRGVCVVCQTPFAAKEQVGKCPACAARYHPECWKFNGGCGMYGCAKAPATEARTSLEIPASHWGSENKACPNCGLEILAAAIRCRHCGATFASSTPQGEVAFRARERIKSQRSRVRTDSIVLLVCSMLPCTAPLAAVFGVFWYVSKRDVIRSLPGINAAISKIALVVAWLQTAALIAVMLFYDGAGP